MDEGSRKTSCDGVANKKLSNKKKTCNISAILKVGHFLSKTVVASSKAIFENLGTFGHTGTSLTLGRATSVSPFHKISPSVIIQPNERDEC